jgi:hypothetical protein
MRAGVQEGVDRPAAIAVEDEFAAADGAGDEIAGVADLRAVAEIEPAAKARRATRNRCRWRSSTTMSG